MLSELNHVHALQLNARHWILVDMFDLCHYSYDRGNHAITSMTLVARYLSFKFENHTANLSTSMWIVRD